jgi:predicted HTH transcriptional regulator
MTTTNQILESIDQRLRDAKAEIDTLTAARDALGGRERRTTQSRRRSRTTAAASTPSAPTGKPRTPGRRSRTRTSTRAANVVPAGRLESLLSQNGGMTTTALAERTNGNRDQILTLLRELEAAGRVRRSGQRRGTRWHAITDEDRIQARAAELASRRKR